MVFRSYGIIEDAGANVLVMGEKKSGFLKGFLVLFGGRTERNEPTKEGFIRELMEESHNRVECPPDEVRRFTKILVSDPTPAELYFFRCTNPTYTVGEIPQGDEIGAVVAVSIDKVLLELPDNPDLVTPALVAGALVKHYGGGVDIDAYRSSGIMRAVREYLVKYYYDS